MIYKSIPEIEQIFLGSTAIGKIFNGSDLVFKKDDSPYSGDYIIFEDPDVKSYIVSQYGNTSIGEITYAQAAAVTDFSYFSWDGGASAITNPFYDNRTINYFDELQYFTGLTTIGANTFWHCDRLYSVVLPDTITRIEKGTFADCQYLENITLPPNLTYIGMNAFNNCNAFTEIIVPETVTYIGLGAFAGCDNLAYVTLPSTITEIANSLFSATPISYIDIPSTVTTIGGDAFFNCTYLTSVVLPQSLTTIEGGASEYGAFGKSGLTSINIPSSVTYIGRDAFYRCTSMTSITCNATTPPTLGIRAFDNTNNCPIYVPSASLDAYKSAWSDYASRIQAIPTNISFADPDVKSIIVSNYGSNGEITDAQAAAVTTFFSGTDKTTNPFYSNTAVDLFDEFSYFTGLTAIGDNAFRKCSKMQSITIPTSVTSIGNYTFGGCTSLTSVTIPASVTSIGGSAFSLCSGLTSITCLATTPPTLGVSVFNSTNDCPIYVPAASVETYKSTTKWSSYASRIQAIS